MVKFIKRMALAVLAVSMLPFASFAQQQPVPVDPDVRIGKLDNGLTYYIRHNETPKGQADFYIAQKVGSALEEENQRGLAHFLEHMCFNGTENFPNNALIDWLESIGVKFGANLNAYTGFDETVYNISNVPIARQSVQDSCLLILHDWANALTLDPEEIDKERGVIQQEWRRSMVGQMRLLEKLLPVMYDGNKYGERLPIGTLDVIENFPPQAIRDYYETWYRPDQQGLVIVGDIDVDYIEGKIKEMFADIEMPDNAKERIYIDVDDNDGTIYALGADPEQQVGIVELMFKTDPIPNEMKSDASYLVMKYMLNMAESMLDQRLTDITNQPDAPFAQAGAEYGMFMVSKTKDSFAISVVAKGNDVLPGFEVAYRELLRALRGGFTVGEYDRTRSEYLSRLEKAYNGRDKRESEEYVNEYVRNFIDNEPIPSIEDEYALMNQIANMVTVDYINSLLPSMITDDNRVLLGLFPENAEFKVPTQTEFEEIIAKVDGEEIEPYLDAMKAEPLIPELPTPGTVVSVADDAQWGAKVITLSNGVKVVVKTTDFKKDEIRFDAIAIGGSSIYGDDKAIDVMFLPIADTNSGLGDYNSTDMQRYLQGKQASLTVSIDDYNREMEGFSTVKDLPILMELIYMTFTDYNITEDDFAAVQSKYASILANAETNPQFVFQKMLMKSLYGAQAKQAPTSDIINAATREGVLDIAHAMVANAADYTFFFVGDITVEAITPLLEQYIATLPADAATASKTYATNADLEIKGGKGLETFTTKMETPQTWCAVFVEGSMPYTPKDRQMASIAGQILSNRLLKKIREEMGAVYSIGAGSTMTRQGIYNTMIQVPFPMKPEMKEEVLNEIEKMIMSMDSNITAEELNPIKEYMVKSAIESKEKNDSWIGSMAATVLNDVDIFNDNVDVINSITIEDMMSFMKQLLGQGNYRVVILDPAE